MSDQHNVDFEVIRLLQELGYSAEIKTVLPKKLSTVIIVEGKEFTVRYWGTQEDVDNTFLKILEQIA